MEDKCVPLVALLEEDEDDAKYSSGEEFEFENSFGTLNFGVCKGLQSLSRLPRLTNNSGTLKKDTKICDTISLPNPFGSNKTNRNASQPFSGGKVGVSLGSLKRRRPSSLKRANKELFRRKESVATG